MNKRSRTSLCRARVFRNIVIIVISEQVRFSSSIPIFSQILLSNTADALFLVQCHSVSSPDFQWFSIISSHYQRYCSTPSPFPTSAAAAHPSKMARSAFLDMWQGWAIHLKSPGLLRYEPTGCLGNGSIAVDVRVTPGFVHRMCIYNRAILDWLLMEIYPGSSTLEALSGNSYAPAWGTPMMMITLPHL